MYRMPDFAIMIQVIIEAALNEKWNRIFLKVLIKVRP